MSDIYAENHQNDPPDGRNDDLWTTEQREKAAAAKTRLVTRYWWYHPEERKARARKALRQLGERYKTEDGMANVALEGLWNIMSGNDEDPRA